MDLTTIGTLALLALADSTSFGTLLIPIWLLLAAGRPRPRRLLAYLGVVAACYFVIGLLLSLGASVVLDGVRDWFATDTGAILLVILGAAMIAGSFLFRRRAPSTRVLRWRERAMAADGSIAPLAGIAVTAVALEVATMLPYLLAIGILDGAELSILGHGAALAGYCLVMIVPALALLGARIAAHRAVEPVLLRINGWFERNGAETTGWIVGIVGFLVARNGVQQLGGLDQAMQALTSVLDAVLPA